MTEKRLSQTRKEAIGLAFWWAVGGEDPWKTINSTGSLISLLFIATKGEPLEARTVMQAHREWGDALRQYPSEDETTRQSNALHGVWVCRKICGDLGDLVEKYGKDPEGGFSLTKTAESAK